MSADLFARLAESTPAWFALAECKGLDAALFYPETYGPAAEGALRVCRTCPVRVECLDHAIANHETLGVRGGTTPKQRQTITNAQPAAFRVDWTGELIDVLAQAHKRMDHLGYPPAVHERAS